MATFDALGTAHALEGAGMERRQAEAVAAACRDAAGMHGADVATKADIAAAVAPLATRAELAVLEARLTWRVVGIVIGTNGVFAALIVGLLIAVLDRLP